MRNAVILAAVLMMATGANGQTPQTPAPAAAAPAVELKVGDQAPDFTLQATDGKTYTLSKDPVSYTHLTLPTNREV